MKNDGSVPAGFSSEKGEVNFWLDAVRDFWADTKLDTDCTDLEIILEWFDKRRSEFVEIENEKPMEPPPNCVIRNVQCRFCDCNPCMCGRRDYGTSEENRRRDAEDYARTYKDADVGGG